jgi:hypothetical protein
MLAITFARACEEGKERMIGWKNNKRKETQTNRGPPTRKGVQIQWLRFGQIEPQRGRVIRTPARKETNLTKLTDKYND